MVPLVHSFFFLLLIFFLGVSLEGRVVCGRAFFFFFFFFVLWLLLVMVGCASWCCVCWCCVVPTRRRLVVVVVFDMWRLDATATLDWTLAVVVVVVVRGVEGTATGWFSSRRSLACCCSCRTRIRVLFRRVVVGCGGGSLVPSLDGSSSFSPSPSSRQNGSVWRQLFVVTMVNDDDDDDMTQPKNRTREKSAWGLRGINLTP